MLGNYLIDIIKQWEICKFPIVLLFIHVSKHPEKRLGCLHFLKTTFFGLNLYMIINKCPIIPPQKKHTKSSFLRLYSSIQRHYSRVIDDYFCMGQHMLRYGSAHPPLWVSTSSAMGQGMLGYESAHAPLWVRACSAMGQHIVLYGSAHSSLWVSASSAMG